MSIHLFDMPEKRNFIVCSLEDDKPLSDLYAKVPYLKRLDYDLKQSLEEGCVVYEENTLLPLLGHRTKEIEVFLAATVSRLFGSNALAIPSTIKTYVYSAVSSYVTIDVMLESGHCFNLTYVAYYPVVGTMLIQRPPGILERQ